MSWLLITYVGPHAHGVEVDELPWLPVIERDVPTEVPEEVAKRLLQQETNWVESKPKAPVKDGK